MSLSLEEQIRRIKKKYPEAYAYLVKPPDLELPQFDDNDEIIVQKRSEKK